MNSINPFSWRLTWHPSTWHLKHSKCQSRFRALKFSFKHLRFNSCALFWRILNLYNFAKYKITTSGTLRSIKQFIILFTILFRFKFINFVVVKWPKILIIFRTYLERNIPTWKRTWNTVRRRNNLDDNMIPCKLTYLDPFWTLGHIGHKNCLTFLLLLAIKPFFSKMF